MKTPDLQPGEATLAQAFETLRADLDLHEPPETVLASARAAAAATLVAPAARRSWSAPAVLGPLKGRRATAAALSLAAPLSHAASPAAAPQPRQWRAWFKGTRPLWSAYGGAATCAAVLLGSLALMVAAPRLMPPPLPAVEVGAHEARPQGPAADGPSPAVYFMPLVSPDHLRQLTQAEGAAGAPSISARGPGSGAAPGWLLTTELPQERLATFGLPYDPGRAAEPMRAELLLAGSGEVLAVRLLD